MDSDNNIIKVSEIRNKNYKFIIPYFQRGYKWRPEEVGMLLNDLDKYEANESDKDESGYFMQVLSVKEENKGKSGNGFVVIDGQQRLTTLHIIYKYLNDKPLFEFEFGRDADGGKSRNDYSIDEVFIARARDEIFKFFEEKTDEDKDKFARKIENARFIWHEVGGSGSQDEHRIFENLNSGKIQLSNADLIRALFLNPGNDLGDLKRYQIAAGLEEMESMFALDRFWYMFNRTKDDSNCKARLDFLYNAVFGIKKEDYIRDNRQAFFKLKVECNLLEWWGKIRSAYNVMVELHEDPFAYHYVGFLNYIGCLDGLMLVLENENSDLIEARKERSKEDFKEFLKEAIRRKMKLHDISEYGYDDGPKALRQIFVLHNIETILGRYSDLQKNSGYDLEAAFEYFPFDLLYKESFDIEHINSQTENSLTKDDDKMAWLDSVKNDYRDDAGIKKILDNNCCDSDKAKEVIENFDKVYSEIMRVLRGKYSDDWIKEENENGIGNLVLLDSVTNRSFKNSLFPRKRSIILDNKDNRYIPPCTRDCYTKSYNLKEVRQGCWTKDDYKYYLKDIEEKLGYYLPSKVGVNNG